MSEETHDAAIRGPVAIRLAVLVSGVIGWMLTITFCFCMRDFEGILATPTGLPAAQIFLNAGGRTGGTFMWFWVILIQFFTGCSALLANTRMAYAFARDGAFPFSRQVVHSPSKRQLLRHTQSLELHQSIYSDSRECGLASRSFQYMPRPHRYRVLPDYNRHIQHHGTCP